MSGKKETTIIICAVVSLTKELNILIKDKLEESDYEASTNYSLILQLQKSDKPPRVTNYVESVVSSFTGDQFQSNFRMSYEAYIHLLRLISPQLIRRESGPHNIPAGKQLLAVIWILSTPDS
ncbi:hypothetical protein QE152_g40143 [Popillia japonica]|uniref:Uncharacterized protein n=1 Tax=Popillia japonica TaxID=7064 RepID=A0AAW1HS28_POPJA